MKFGRHVGDYVTVSTRVKREMVERRELGINTQFLREKLEEEFRRRGVEALPWVDCTHRLFTLAGDAGPHHVTREKT